MSLNRYKEVTHAEVNHQSPKAILSALAAIEAEIGEGILELEGILK